MKPDINFEKIQNNLLSTFDEMATSAGSNTNEVQAYTALFALADGQTISDDEFHNPTTVKEIMRDTVNQLLNDAPKSHHQALQTLSRNIG